MKKISSFKRTGPQRVLGLFQKHNLHKVSVGTDAAGNVSADSLMSIVINLKQQSLQMEAERLTLTSLFDALLTKLDDDSVEAISELAEKSLTRTLDSLDKHFESSMKKIHEQSKSRLIVPGQT